MFLLRKYGTGTGADVRIPITKRGVVDFAVGADWSPASGDVKVSKDGGAAANIATLPTALASGNTAQWVFVFSDSELQCKELCVTVSDSATKAVEDTMFIIETYGHASARFIVDLGAPDFGLVANLLNTVNLGNTYNVNNSVAKQIRQASGAVSSDAQLDTGTAQAGGASTITLRAGASAVNNAYQWAVIEITSGTGAGQSRVITAYVGATKVATVDRAWTTNPDNTSVYEISETAVSRVGSYVTGQDPATLVKATTLDETPTTGTLEEALVAARAQGFGKWALVGTTLTLYASDGSTPVKQFTLDSATAPTSRTPV